MDTLDLTSDFDISEYSEDGNVDLALYQMPELTPEEMRLIAPFLPADFGKPSATAKPKIPAQSSLTPYSEKISIRIPHPILAMIKEEAKRRGFPYQTFINLILGAHATGHCLQKLKPVTPQGG